MSSVLRSDIEEQQVDSIPSKRLEGTESSHGQSWRGAAWYLPV